MRFLNKILNFYIFSNIHVAIAGYCMTKITLIKYGVIAFNTPLFVALSIIISYNFIRFYEIKKIRLSWFKEWFFDNNIKILILSLISVLLMFYTLFFTPFYLKSLFILIPFSFMTLFYAVPLFKIGNVEFSFRNYPSIKIFSIAIAWAGISVFFPLYEAKISFSFDVYLEFLQRFSLLFAIIIPFDIRDINSDAINLKTIPQVFGVKKSKLIGFSLLIVALFLEVLKQPTNINEFFIFITVLIITALFLVFSTKKRSRYYASFWVESIPIIWLILIVLFLNY